MKRFQGPSLPREKYTASALCGNAPILALAFTHHSDQDTAFLSRALAYSQTSGLELPLAIGKDPGTSHPRLLLF